MATIRSSLPSRLRQLLSSENNISPSIKIDSETPPRVKALIDKVIQFPLEDISIPLSGFHWEYGKGNFHHWRPLFLHFDSYFKTHLSNRNDLCLSDDILGDTVPFPKQAVLQILRVLQIILENCQNKSSFCGLEHFRFLLASTDPEILIATLNTLAALVKIIPSKLHASGKLVGCGVVNSCLLSLAQGWGSKEEGLGLYSCVVANEKTQDEGLSLFPSDAENDSGKTQSRLGSTLYFEVHDVISQSQNAANVGKELSSIKVINIPGVHLRKEDDLSIMKSCMEQHNVSSENRFSLITRIRFAHALRSSRICRLYSKVCLLAFIVLVQSSDSHDELVSFFANEPEYTNDLIRIVRSEEPISASIRTLAMNALGAQLAAYASSHERARILGSSMSFGGGNRMILLNVLQKAILSLRNSSDASSISFTEALLQFYLLHVLSSSTSGSVIRGSGMVPTFLPLLEDSEPMHMHLVCLAVKTLQKLMDYSNAAVTLFKDMGGVELLAQRLQIEVDRVINSSRADGESSSSTVGQSSRLSDDQIHIQKRLIRALLKALGSATYAPANSARGQNSQDVSLPVTLTLIFGNVDKFGGDIYSSAVTLMSEIIHKDPTSFPSLHEVGLPNAFLTSVVAGVLPSSKAITCVPNGLGAVCLNTKGLEAVRETSSLRFLVDIFTDKKYIVALNEGIVPLANAVEELLRHVSSLRSTGVDFIIEIINRIAALGETKDTDCSGKPGSSEMEIDQKDSDVSCLVGSADSAVEAVTNDQFIQLCIFHVMVLVHRAMENAETCRLFVDKSGIEALLKLLLRPTISQSSEGMSIALHSTMVFKAFTQHHSAPLARAFCSSLGDHLKKALSGFSEASESFLLDPKVSSDSGVFSSLFLVEFLLFLAASKDSRWVNALLTEFGSGSKGVLEDIGKIHREVMWQISLLEDAKVDDESPTASESQQSESAGDDTDEQRFNSFRQLLDPLLRRRMSGWSFESQFFDLINLYRDLSRTSSSQHRLALDGASDQTSGPLLSDGPGTSRPKDADKRRSYYHSCCDMVRSLSIHITYLFQELGKAMLLPSRRREDLLNVTASAKAVASTFASIGLDHINLKDCTSYSRAEAAVSAKCCYFGKVIDFIDGILLDKPDLCNPVLLNCLYGHGVIHSVVTTFQATSQLHFAVNRTPASPMDTDEGSVRQDKTEDTDYSWIYGPLACYGKLMDHLVTSSLILSPFTKHLLTQPLVSGGDIPFPRDPETFVKVLQSMVLKAVIPVWSHSQFTECNHEFIATVLSIMKHIYSGVEVKNVNSSSGRVSGPPPNETTISTIVEMGFSRPRAEEALRQVGSNSVELAMEWLFSHPEEIQEDDELARALAMSLGNSDAKEDGSTCDRPTIEEAAVQPPPVEDLLSTCKKLLQMKESLAFPVRDLLVMICSQNDGQYRSTVISFIIEQVKLCSDNGDIGNMDICSSFFHVLALILNEDAVAREVASTCGLVKVVIDLLSVWNSSSYDKEASQVPKWVTAAFIVIDRLAQVGQKLNNADLSELLVKDDSGDQNSNFMDEEKQNKLQELLGLSAKHLDVEEQLQLIQIACNSIQKSLPSETMHAVLQICSTLTRTHSVAVKFLENGGLHSLLSLPTSSLFVGFDNVAATIIRHILEDPQTLQLAMESEIRHSVVMASNRQPTGRLTARNFLLNLTSVIQRDPVIFLQAARSVCQVEMVSDRPYIVLLKDRDKDKSKEKEKAEDKQQSSEVKTAVNHVSTLVPGSGLGKPQDTTSKNVKAHKKPPTSFTTVMELLLDSIVTFVPPLKDPLKDETQREPSSKDMDIDTSGLKGKGKAVASVPESDESIKQDSSAPMVRVVFILKLLTESLLMYASSIHVVLRRDVEISSSRGGPQRAVLGHFSGGIFYHILHKFLPYPKSSKKERKTDVDWRQKLAGRASQFLVASCVRSTEARKRIFTEILAVFNDFLESCEGFRVPGIEIQAFIDLLNDVLAARSPTGSYISAEASVTFIDVGLVRSLTRALNVFDLDNADSSKVATALVKVLEVVTKEHVHAVELNAGKSENSAKPSDHNREGTNIGADVSQPLESAPQANVNSISAEPFSTLQSFGGSEAMTDDMEHDQDMDGGFAPPSEDDFMHGNSEDSRAIESSLNSGGIRFEIQPDVQQNIDEDDDDEDDDDDDDMSGDEGDDVDEDEEGDEEHNGLEEDEMHHLPHAESDQDDNDMEEDEFDEEVMEGEEEDDEDEEDGVILRLGEGMNGINVFDHIEVLGREHSLNSETLHVMPVEVFGSRGQGRTTSIYNLLGRGSDGVAPTQHPLLLEPSMSLQSGSARRSEISRDSHADRNAEAASSRLESVFRSLRNGRHGHRLNIWAGDQQSGGSSGSSIPQGLEDLLVSNLRRPAPERPTDTGPAVEPQEKRDALENTDSITMEPLTQGENNNVSERDVSPPSTTLEPTVSIDVLPTGLNTVQGGDPSTQQNQISEMQFEQNDVVRDVEAVSQESSGSGATLGESLRSLDVEIGSADGHEESGERHIAGESRSRRANVLLGNSVSGSLRDASLHSVNEVAENPSQEADQSGSGVNEPQNRDASSGSIDPAFLEALPDELRAEVLSAQPGQAAQPQSTEPQSTGDIDPEFLAALPPDIREEVLAQQRAQRRNQSQELEGQPVEMDTVSIIATFPSDVREEVLLTSSDAILANLTPALVAEANMLRERFARRYNRSLFGMYPRNRRGEVSRRVGGESLDGVGGILSRRSMGTKLVEADGSPLVGTEDLKAMVRLFRVVQPIYKGQLQRLLLNLCAHAETRTSLVKIMMDLLMLDLSKPSSCLNTIEPPYRLYGCQSHVMYSRPQYLEGVPPLVSRRVLETLTYLARNHLHVARILLEFKLHLPSIQEQENSDARGKAIMVAEDVDLEQKGQLSLSLLLGLLKHPLYMRSISHLEQLLNLLDVIIDNAESKSISSDKPSVGQPVAAAQLSSDAHMSTGSGSNSSEADETSRALSLASGLEQEAEIIQRDLPKSELRLLCSLLAREGLSDNAYALAANVLKKLVSIAPTHCQLFINELACSVQSLIKSAMDELHIFENVEKAFLATASCDGAAILRVLQALSSLLSSLNNKDKGRQFLTEQEHAAVVALVWDINAALEPLWQELSSSISKIEGYLDVLSETSHLSISKSKPSGAMPPLPAGTQSILPYIESFFVMCEKLHPGPSDPGHDASMVTVSSSMSDTEEVGTSGQQRISALAVKVDEKHVAFVKFAERHRKLLNAFVRQNPGLLEKSFSLMLKVPRFVDFDNKRAYFRSKIKHLHDHHHSPLRISVRRAYILEDSYNQLRMRSAQDLKGRLTVHFQGEEGIDAGGLTREWYQLLSRVIFDKGALLFTTVGNESTFQPNPNSVYQTEHLSYFKFVGRVVGKALFDGQLLDVHFTRSFYKHILGVKVTYHDIEAIDPGYFKNLKWLLENDISDIVDLTFSIDADEEKLILYERNEVTDYELIPNGRNIRVTEENKHQYVDLVAEHRLTTAIRPQINAFLEGFNELISRDLISIFNDKELELLISGLPDIDLDDMRANTEYSGYSVASPVIQWFWDVAQAFSKEDKARLLQFVTGTSKVPLEGFSALQGISGSQKFQIHKAYGSPEHLPSAHTCFNQLDMPEYPSKEHLEERLLLAIHEGNEGFGFG